MFHYGMVYIGEMLWDIVIYLFIYFFTKYIWYKKFNFGLIMDSAWF